MPASEPVALPDDVITRPAVRAVGEPVEEIVIRSDSGRVIRAEAREDRRNRRGTGLCDPFRDRRLLPERHQDQGPEHAHRIPRRSARGRRVSLREDGHDRVKVQFRQDEKLLTVVFQGFGELLIPFVQGEVSADMPEILGMCHHGCLLSVFSHGDTGMVHHTLSSHRREADFR